MLRKLTIKNYKGFKEEAVFDLTNVKKYSFNENSIKNDTIKTAIIYGKNGTGKSNLGLAIFDLIFHLTDRNKDIDQDIGYLNGDSDEQFASFEYEFFLDGEKFTYAYRKLKADILVYESLFINDKKIFSFNFIEQKRDLDGLASIGLETLNFRENMKISILRYIYHNTNITKTNPIYKLMKFINHMLWYRSTSEGNQYIGLSQGSGSLEEEIINRHKTADFETFLRKYGLNYKLGVQKLETNQNILLMKFNNRAFIFNHVASHGTKALLLLYYWMLHEEEISFLFIDEFDAFFHTELAEQIIRDLSKQSNHQIIITTHNTNLMSNTILRPDCYFIVCEDRRIIALPEATTRELREGHNLEKMYLSGVFNEC